MHTTGLVEFLDSLLMVHPWQHAEGFGFGVGVYLNTILERSTTSIQHSAFALADCVLKLKALGVACNTWSTDCIDGDEQVLIVNGYIETIKNPIIKDYLERRVAECEKE